MPLPRRRKYGLSYVYTPAFVQQLGVFSQEEVSANLENEFHKRLRSSYVLADYAFHSGSRKSKTFQERVNYTLDLSQCYEDLFRSFNANRKRIIRKGFQNLTLEKSQAPEFFLEHLDEPDLGFLPDASMNMQLKRLMEQNPDHVQTWNAYLDDLWVGGLLWLKDQQRITYLFPVTTKKGKELDAPTFILNNLIQDHQGAELLLDLEGSMIPGVALFYRSFGARQETYYFIKSRLYGLF